MIAKVIVHGATREVALSQLRAALEGCQVGGTVTNLAFLGALARHEGIIGGFSGGANVAAALDLLRGPHKGQTIAALICDSGLKYLSTDLWPSTAD